MEILGYQIVRELGRGGMATVYLSVQQSLGRQVALKVMNPGLVSSSGFQERFHREGRIVAQMVHPRIVTVYDFGSQEDIHFLSMEYLPGGSLTERIQEGLQPEQSAEIIVPIANALAYAHRYGVVHRDVKPQNILFRADGASILTDFGIARVLDVDRRLTQTGFIIGSPRYMSPEQVFGRVVDSRSDIYSLGIVFYEMLTGNIPWSDTEGSVGLAMKHCSAPIPALAPQLRRYQELIEKLLAKEPDDRYQNADDFASDLSDLVKSESYESELPTVVFASPGKRGQEAKKPPNVETQQPPLKKSHARSIGFVIFLAIVLVALGGYFGTDYLIGEGDDALLMGVELPPAKGDRPIAGNYELLAIQHLRKQQYDLSMELVRAGLTAVPRDNRLLALQGVVQKHQAARKHLEIAKGYFEQGVLEASSLEVEKGLQAVPDHRKLQELQGQLETKLQERHERKAEQLLEQAQQDLRAGDLDAGLARVSEGLWLVPDHQALLSLRDKIVDQVARQRQVDAFLEQAHRLEQQERWQQALGAVRKGLSIDADDPGLKASEERLEAGLERYRLEETDSLLAEAVRQRDAGEFEASFRLIEDGLSLVPEHSGLLKLRSELQRTIERLKRSQELLVRARVSAAANDLETSLRLIDEGLSLTYDNQELLQIKERVEASIRDRAAQEARNLFAQASALRDAGELEKSLDLISKGLDLIPSDGQLRTLRDRLQAEITERMRRAEEANALFVQARNRLKANAPEDTITLTDQVLTLVPTHSGASALKRQALDEIVLQKARTHAKELLTNARQFFAVGRLEDARSQVVQGIAELPDNDELIALRNEIEQRQVNVKQSADFRSQAKAKLGAGAIEEALELVDRALLLTPENAEALDLRGLISAQLDLRRTVSSYLADAQRLRGEGDLERSLDRIDAALQLVSDAPQVLALREQVTTEIDQSAREKRAQAEQESRREQAAALLHRAQKMREEGDLQKGLSLALQGLELVPDDTLLSELNASLQAEIEKQRAIEQQKQESAQEKAAVQTRLAQCQEHLHAKRLTTGKEGTAFQCFKGVLKMEPDNNVAHQGLQQIADQYAAWAAGALDGKTLSSARTYIERLATVDSGYGELDNLRQRLDQLQKALSVRPKPRRKGHSAVKSTKPKATTRRRSQPRTGTRRPIVTRKGPASTPPPTKHKPPPRETAPKAPPKKRPMFGTF